MKGERNSAKWLGWALAAVVVAVFAVAVFGLYLIGFGLGIFRP